MYTNLIINTRINCVCGAVWTHLKNWTFEKLYMVMLCGVRIYEERWEGSFLGWAFWLLIILVIVNRFNIHVTSTWICTILTQLSFPPQQGCHLVTDSLTQPWLACADKVCRMQSDSYPTTLQSRFSDMATQRKPSMFASLPSGMRLLMGEACHNSSAAGIIITFWITCCRNGCHGIQMFQISLLWI